ncbi:MAG TPA: YfcE family phosphodiesterase [Candidatus Thermoplasmatota archaeon]|nr:YfcE family phosphodiesterase [Candidatus Thermoplasmatota archaeon]
MRIGLVADTHDNLPLCRAAARFLRDEAPDLVLHLGDVTSPATLDAFEGLRAQVLVGNNDDARALGRKAEALGWPAPARDWSATLDGVLVAAHHGHLPPRLPGEPDVLLHGHTHRRRAETAGRTLVVNPGALFRAPTKTIAVLELPARRVAFFEVKEEGVSPLG